MMTRSSTSRTACKTMDRLRLSPYPDSRFCSVHGGPHKEPILIDRDHEEGLSEMDILSEFAPLHVSSLTQRQFYLHTELTSFSAQNHSAVLAIRCKLHVSKLWLPLD